MHIPDISEILLPPRLGTDAFLPAVNEIQYSRHDRTGKRGRSFRESADELVQKLFGGDLEVQWVSARLDEGVEEGKGENSDVGGPVVC